MWVNLFTWQTLVTTMPLRRQTILTVKGCLAAAIYWAIWAHALYSLYFTVGQEMPPKLPLSLEGIRTPTNIWFIEPTQVHPKRHLNQFVVLWGSWPWPTHTLWPWNIGNKRLHLMLCIAMQHNNNMVTVTRFVFGFYFIDITADIWQKHWFCVLCSFCMQLKCEILVSSDIWCAFCLSFGKLVLWHSCSYFWIVLPQNIVWNTCSTKCYCWISCICYQQHTTRTVHPATVTVGLLHAYYVLAWMVTVKFRSVLLAGKVILPAFAFTSNHSIKISAILAKEHCSI